MRAWKACAMIGNQPSRKFKVLLRGPFPSSACTMAVTQRCCKC